MKNNLLKTIFITFLSIFYLSSCNNFNNTSSSNSSSENKFIEIFNEDELTIEVGQIVIIETIINNLSEPITYFSDLTYIANFTGNWLRGYYEGSTIITAQCGDYQDFITVNVIPNPEPDFIISVAQTELTTNKSYKLRSTYSGSKTEFVQSSDFSLLAESPDPFGNFRIRTYEKEGLVSFFVRAGDEISNSILVHISSDTNSNF